VVDKIYKSKPFQQHSHHGTWLNTKNRPTKTAKMGYCPAGALRLFVQFHGTFYVQERYKKEVIS